MSHHKHCCKSDCCCVDPCRNNQFGNLGFLSGCGGGGGIIFIIFIIIIIFGIGDRKCC